jgi:hypothetical protein
LPTNLFTGLLRLLRENGPRLTPGFLTSNIKATAAGEWRFEVEIGE